MVFTEPRSFLAGAVEYYLCELFGLYNSSRSGGWWCDGVLELTITQPSPTSFQLVGVAYWAGGPHSPFYLAPFELEFHFKEVGDSVTERIVLRFGVEGRDGLIKKVPCDSNLQFNMVRKRPQQNSDWALAIELT